MLKTKIAHRKTVRVIMVMATRASYASTIYLIVYGLTIKRLGNPCELECHKIRKCQGGLLLGKDLR